jgi:hypothetical protein
MDNASWAELDNCLGEAVDNYLKFVGRQCLLADNIACFLQVGMKASWHIDVTQIVQTAARLVVGVAGMCPFL